MRTAIKTRISRRSFEKTPLTESEQTRIAELVANANAVSGLTCEFIEDARTAFASFRATYGLFVNPRSVVLLKGDREKTNLQEITGYVGEDLILDLTDMNLGTCWVGGTFDKSKFEAAPNEEIVCAVLVGKVRRLTIKERAIRAVLSERRKKIEERLTTTADVGALPDWLVAGMEAVCLAPSAKNRQKVVFRYDGTNVTAETPTDYRFDLVDLGIAKRHFEIEAGGRFDVGNGAAFHKD